MPNFNNLLDDEDIEVVPALKKISTINKTGDKGTEANSEIVKDNIEGTEGNSGTTEDGAKGAQGNSGETKKTRKKKEDTVDTNSVLESLMRKKETARLGLTIDKEIYDKLKTISMTNYNETGTKKSVTKVVSELLKEALKNVKIDYDLVEAFDDNFKEKRKK